MKKFNVTFTREFVEHGTLTIKANNINEAREIAESLLTDDDPSIEWDHGTLETQSVEEVRCNSK